MRSWNLKTLSTEVLKGICSVRISDIANGSGTREFSKRSSKTLSTIGLSHRKSFRRIYCLWFFDGGSSITDMNKCFIIKRQYTEVFVKLDGCRRRFFASSKRRIALAWQARLAAIIQVLRWWHISMPKFAIG